MNAMTIVDTRIVRATEADIPAILSMIAGLAEYEHFEDLLTADEDGLRETLFSDRPAAEVLLATIDGECVGFAVFYETFCSILGRRGCFMDHLFVPIKYRVQGIGKKLMKEIAQISRSRKYARLEWMVLDWNEPAICFYEKQGTEFLVDWTKCRLDDDAISALAD